MKTTSYFEQSVRERRPYLRDEWLAFVLQHPVKIETQPNGRTRYWAFIPELGKYLRVIVEPDGETVHNAFPDRSFRL